MPPGMLRPKPRRQAGQAADRHRPALHRRGVSHRRRGVPRQHRRPAHGHVFLCTLAYYVEWHLRQRVQELLFDDPDIDPAARCDAPVGEARPSARAGRKYATGSTPEGLPLHSLTTLLADLATRCVNQLALTGNPVHTFAVTTQPTPLQQRAFDLLEVEPAKVFPV